MNNSFAKMSSLLSSIFSGCLRSNQVILAVIHYSLNIFCEWCSVCSSSSGSPLGSVQNQSCLPKAPCVFAGWSPDWKPGALHLSGGPNPLIHLVCLLLAMQVGALWLDFIFWHVYTCGQASAQCAQTPSQLHPTTGQPHMQVPSFGSSFA